jgi:radical SAM protein with 4Fe4S-binding SPASM domain
MSISCEQLPRLSDEAYWNEFSSKIERLRIPFSGGIALTNRCNLTCLHCYAKEDAEGQEDSGPELSTKQWEKTISEIKDAGCLYLLITGGEPLLRDDFAAIYSYAKSQGFLITVFSNGTLVNSEIVELFRELPPQRIEITLYGASAATHDRITGVPGSYERCLRGIEMLLAGNINVALKSILMTLNLDEFPAIEKIAQNYGISFRLDAAIFPALAGDRSALDLRVSPAQAIANEFVNPKMFGEWRDFLNRFHATDDKEDIYSCSAGTTTFHIDPYGLLYPCLMVRKPNYSLLNGSFRQGWTENMPRIKEVKAGTDFACRGCRQKLLCGYCPGFFELENGSEQIPSPYLCALGKLRLEMINHEISGG